MDKSPFFVEYKPLTPADELRDQIAQLEAKVAQLGRRLEPEPLTVLASFDKASTTMAELQASGQTMRAEEARLEAVSAGLKRKAGTFLREIGGADVLEEARRARQPDPAAWWWFLDQFLADQRRTQLRRLLQGAGGAAVILLVLAVLYQRFLAPDPATQERLRHESAAESLVMDGNLAGALSEVEQALVIAPGDANLLTFKGALQQKLGQSAAAEQTFAAAEAAFGNRETFLLTRGQTYLRLGQGEATLADAQAAIALNPKSAIGYLLLGQANEALENYQEAIAAYQQAGTLADAQNNPQIAVIARINLATLMQRLPIQSGDN